MQCELHLWKTRWRLVGFFPYVCTYLMPVATCASTRKKKLFVFLLLVLVIWCTLRCTLTFFCAYACGYLTSASQLYNGSAPYIKLFYLHSLMHCSKVSVFKSCEKYCNMPIKIISWDWGLVANKDKRNHIKIEAWIKNLFCSCPLSLNVILDYLLV